MSSAIRNKALQQQLWPVRGETESFAAFKTRRANGNKLAKRIARGHFISGGHRLA